MVRDGQSPRWSPLRTSNGPSVPVAGIHSSLTWSTMRGRRTRRGAARAGRRGGRAGLRRRSGPSRPSCSRPSRRARGPSPRAARNSGSRRPGRGRGRWHRAAWTVPRGATIGGQAAALRDGQAEDQRIEHELGRDVRRRAAPPSARRGRGTPRPTRRDRPPRSRSAHRAGPVSWTERAPPEPTRARSRATSAHRPSRISTPRRRSTAGILAGAGVVVASARRGRRRAAPAAGAAAAGDGAAADRRGRGRPVAGASVVPVRVAGSPGTEGGGQGDRARDRGPGRGQAGRRAGIGQVEQDARELGPDEDRLRGPGVGEREPRPATREPAETRGGRRIGQAVVGEDRLDVARADRARAGAGSSAIGRSAGGAPPGRRRAGS